MANSFVQEANQFKQLVEQAKQQSQSARENMIQQLKAQLEKDKNEVLANL